MDKNGAAIKSEVGVEVATGTRTRVTKGPLGINSLSGVLVPSGRT